MGRRCWSIFLLAPVLAAIGCGGSSGKAATPDTTACPPSSTDPEGPAPAFVRAPAEPLVNAFPQGTCPGDTTPAYIGKAYGLTNVNPALGPSSDPGIFEPNQSITFTEPAYAQITTTVGGCVFNFSVGAGVASASGVTSFGASLSNGPVSCASNNSTGPITATFADISLISDGTTLMTTFPMTGSVSGSGIDGGADAGNSEPFLEYITATR